MGPDSSTLTEEFCDAPFRERTLRVEPGPKGPGDLLGGPGPRHEPGTLVHPGRHERSVATLFAPWVKRKPSEAFAEQCFVSMDTDNGANLGPVAERRLERCVLWGSDYPHYDCIYPGAYKGLLESCAGIDASVVTAVTHDNPRRFMALD